MPKIILLELNEVPNRVFLDSFKEKNLYQKEISEFNFQPTISKDKGHLSPWVTWPTIHRGVTDEKHKIEDINISSNDVDKKYPSIWSTLIKNGFKVGVFGSFHSSMIRNNDFYKYSFVVPDSFTGNYQCKPRSINGIQRLNIIMSRRSARIVDSSFPKVSVLIRGIIL